MERLTNNGYNVLFDIDVKGGVNVKKMYGTRALSVFVQPPSINALRERLYGRGTDTPEVIQDRLDKAEYEMTFSPQFDVVIVNDNLDEACTNTEKLIREFLNA